MRSGRARVLWRWAKGQANIILVSRPAPLGPAFAARAAMCGQAFHLQRFHYMGKLRGAFRAPLLAAQWTLSPADAASIADSGEMCEGLADLTYLGDAAHMKGMVLVGRMGPGKTALWHGLMAYGAERSWPVRFSLCWWRVLWLRSCTGCVHGYSDGLRWLIEIAQVPPVGSVAGEGQVVIGIRRLLAIPS